VRREYPWERFQAAYRDVVSIEPLAVREQPPTGPGATVWACTRLTRTGGAIYRAGNIQVVREGGALRIGTSALAQRPDCASAAP
jgi:hypothetical protein